MNSSKKSRVSLVSASGLFVLVAVSMASLGSGCANIVGVQGGTWDGNVEDGDTKVRTSLLCREYCDEVMDNCSGAEAVYQNRAACLSTCNALPPGDPSASEPEPNSILCRLKQARAAKNAPGELCAGAGPSGSGTCGSNCESWCILLEAACPDDYEELSNCEASCAAIPVAPGFTVAEGYDVNANNLQCRINHLGAALEGPKAALVHCPHTRLQTEGACDQGEGVDPRIAYCQSIQAACTGDNKQYLDVTECETIAFAFEEGDSGQDQSNNTLACRTYHAGAAATDPGMHCPHAGPTGDGTCGDAGEGNCESYCAFMATACGDDFEADFGGTQSACVDACVESGLPGVGANSKYKYSTATATNSLGCRVRRAIEAKTAGPADAGDLCAKARLFASCD